MQKRTRKWLIIAGCLAALLAVGVYNHLPLPPITIEISPQTTLIDGPVNPDGTVNYVAYMDAQYAKGITPANNAAPLLLRALGPELLDVSVRGIVLDKLDLAMPENATYFIPWDKRPKPDADATSADQAQAAAPSEQELGQYEALDVVREGKACPPLEAWLETNAAPLKLVKTATAKPRLYIPLLSSSNPPQVFSLLLPRLGLLKEVACALAARAAMECNRGDIEAAWSDVLAMHRLARLVNQGPTLIEKMVACAIDGLAATAGKDIATRHLSAAVAKAMLADLQGLSPLNGMIDAIDRERLCVLDTVMVLYRKDWSQMRRMIPHSSDITALKSPSIDWNSLLRAINKRYDTSLPILRTSDYAKMKRLAQSDAQAFEKQTSDSIRKMRPLLLRSYIRSGKAYRKASTHAAGTVLLAVFSPSLDSAIGIQRGVDMAFETERVAMALACYHAETGHWPEELTELVPKYLPAEPIDAFAPDALVYQRRDDGYVCYSVGGNMIDDGGKCAKDRVVNGPDDIVVEVKEPAAGDQ